MSTSIGALLLAAGFSKRFGGTKLLASLDNGNSVLGQTYERLTVAIPELVIVTRPELANDVARHGTNPLVFHESDKGMGASLAFGIEQAAKRNWEACMICLADMPFIQVSTYQQLASAAGAKNIVMPSYQGKFGNPVCFGKDFFSELMQVSGDAGGRQVVQLHQERRLEVPVNDSAVLADIDTPDELKRYQQKLK